jgi:tRNA(fMet)-specific endonuclease VapC
MTKYLFDTNIISYFTSGKYPKLVDSILETSPDHRFINWVVQEELLYGVFRKGRVDLELRYQKFFQQCNIIQSDSEIIELCAKLEADLDARGLSLDLEDIWIAATCLVHDLTLVTNNLKHFERFDGLSVEDWI